MAATVAPCARRPRLVGVPAPARLAALAVAGAPERWAAIGFDVQGDRLRLGGVELRLRGAEAGEGLVGWTLAGAVGAELDGLPFTPAPAGPAPPSAPAHPNGVTAVDHVVVVTPDLERTVRAGQAAGLDLRRRADQGVPGRGVPMAFFRVGEAVLEVVEAADAGGPARLWGLALRADLGRAAQRLGDALGPVGPAVQPGRRIATVRRSAGLGVPVALLDAPR